MYLNKANADITVAMLRAFLALSRSLNLSTACEELGLTRHTIRRHIDDLERIKGHPLFTLENRKYALTPFGNEAINGAETILRQLANWTGRAELSRQTSHWLESVQYQDACERDFYSQQYPISQLSKDGLPILKRALAAWGQSYAQVEDPAMSDIRPYLVIYKKSPTGWICVEIGEKSAYAKWFGWAWSKSAIGIVSEADKAGDDFNEFISGAYTRIHSEGGVRFDHIYAHLSRESIDEPVPVSFQRLLLGCVFPDGTQSLAVLVLMTNQIKIDAQNGMEINCVPDDLVMDFDL